MLTFANVTLRRGTRLLFGDASFTVHAGNKVGVTGSNGSGKSSLLAVIQGNLQPDTGTVALPSDLRLAHVAQETPALATPALDYVLDGDRELRAIQHDLRAAEAAHDHARLAELHAGLDAIDAYTAPARAARLLHGLGFSAAQTRQPVNTFSGGWRMRLNLAQALMCRSDLLLLDEPTNHLDLDAVIWLEAWLQKYPGTLLLISHDRDFLDRVTSHILHIERQTLALHTGNYSTFETRRAEQLASQQAAFAKQRRQIAHIRNYISRFGAKATKARQAQSRLKALARLEIIAPAHVDSSFMFGFPAPRKTPNPLLRLEKADVAYAGRRVLRDVNLALTPGSRLCLLGPNGAGKSTLIKLLAGELETAAGRREPAQGLAVGYFAQHQLEQLRLDDTPLGHLQWLAPAAREQELRDFLGGFGFHGEMALAPVAPFSGGEKARLVLALLVYQRPNLLLLDEPTNHLDLDMRHALTMALQTYEGALVVVSHDRHLLRTVSDELWLVNDGRASPFEGDLDDYARWLTERTRDGDRQQARLPAAGHTAGARRERRRESAEARQKLAPLKREIRRLETRLDALHAKQSELERQLAESRLYTEDNKQRLLELTREQSRLRDEIVEVETAWLQRFESLEASENA